jgi:hypothetical protein
MGVACHYIISRWVLFILALQTVGLCEKQPQLALTGCLKRNFGWL